MISSGVYLSGLLALLGAAGGAAAQQVTRHDARTEAAVLAADEARGEAEMSGDAAFVDGLLLPGYRSINADGKTTDEATIVAGAARHAGASDYRAKVTAWRAAHPSRGDVRLFGDTAILTWVSTAPGTNDLISSSDIFVYRAGRWRAVYSQHIKL